MSDWKARRILKEICDDDRRAAVLGAFWTDAEPAMRAVVVAHLARALHFRVETIQKAPLARKCGWLGMPLSVPEVVEAQEMSLMLHHLNHAPELLGAFLDFWKIPHTDGSIAEDDYSVPSEEQVEAAVAALGARFELRDILLYLATAGLLMGHGETGWREATWPVVDRHLAALPPAAGASGASR